MNNREETLRQLKVIEEMFEAGLLRDEEEKEEKKPMLPKGFLTQNGRPTQNARDMFFVYLKHRPQGWNEKKGRCMSAIQKVREHFGVTYGFECMITWGINLGCKNSQTSDGRYHAMSLAYHDAMGMIGQQYAYSNIKL